MRARLRGRRISLLTASRRGGECGRYSRAPATFALIVLPTYAFVTSHSNLPEGKDAKMQATQSDAICINQIELAGRWRISHRTLERWRWTGEGPKFLKIGGRVVYRLSDIEDYERTIVRTSTSDSPSS